VQNILTFIVGIVLARLILPEEFGLLGIAIIFIGFSELFATLGMGAAVIQRRSLTDTHLRVAITFSILLGLIIICVLWILSYPIARFFNNPSVTLILMIISLSFLPKGISAPCRELLAGLCRPFYSNGDIGIWGMELSFWIIGTGRVFLYTTTIYYASSS